jgi:cytochrome c-type biogenesis protein CcmH/NrfF
MKKFLRASLMKVFLSKKSLKAPLQIGFCNAFKKTSKQPNLFKFKTLSFCKFSFFLAKNFSFLLAMFFLLSFSFDSGALSPEVHLESEIDEQRATKLFLQVRCLVCGGQVIENSDSEFSFEMRKLIRAKIADKKSDVEIKNELIAKFGSDILTEVSAKNNGFLLWILPVIFASLFGGFFVLKFV